MGASGNSLPSGKRLIAGKPMSRVSGKVKGKRKGPKGKVRGKLKGLLLAYQK